MGRTFHLIPHTHWDREWYLPRAGFEARLVPLIDDLLELLERDPEIRFHLDGQTVLIEDYLTIQEANQDQARSRLEPLVTAGRLTVGPWYVQPDEQIPSGESLIRNLLLGTADSRRLGGAAPVLYSPDAFGHPAILPTLAAQFGLPYAVVWRGLGSPGDRERDLHRWRGPDGSAVLLYHLPRDGYEVGAELVGPDAELGDRWARLRDRLMARSATDQIAVLVGADHHGPSPRLVGLADRIGQLEPEARVRISSLPEFFAGVEAERPQLEEIAGELRWSYGYSWTLQGIHATRSRLKRAHAGVELELSRIAEPLAVLAEWAGARNRQATVRSAWRRLIQSQFHDSLAGTVVDGVAREQSVRLEAVRVASSEVARASLADLVGHDFDRAREEPEAQRPTLVVWNPAARPREAVVTALVTAFRSDILVGPPSGREPRTGSGHQPFHLRGPGGIAVPIQVLRVETGQERIDAPRHYPDLDRVDRIFLACLPPPLGGLAHACLTIAPGDRPARVEAPAWRRKHQAGNDRVAVTMSRRNGIGLKDLATGVGYQGLLAIEAEADRGDLYTPAIVPGTRSMARVTEVAVLADGPLVSGLGAGWEIAASSGPIRGRTAVAIQAGSDLVRVRIDLMTQAPDQRVRLRIPVGVGGSVLVGTPLGQSRRAPVEVRSDDHPAERPSPTAVAQRLVAAAQGLRGLAVFGPGAFEYEWTAKGEIWITLLRSVGALSRNDLVERPGHAGWPVATPEAQELGSHRIDLAIRAIDRSRWERPAQLMRDWEDGFLPVQPGWFRDFLGQSTQSAGIELLGADLSFEAIKPAEDGTGIVVRAVNRSERAGIGRWRFDRPIARAERVRADESEPRPLEIADGGREVRFGYGPGEVVTIRVGG